MSDATNGEGFRITLGTVYAVLQEQSQRLASMDTALQLQSADITRLTKDYADIKAAQSEQSVRHESDMDKLRSRFNGILIGIGTGVIVGIPALIGLLK